MANMDGGIVYLKRLVNVAAAGMKPAYRLETISRDWYEDRAIGFRRQYAAKGVNEQVDLLIRIHFNKAARIGLYAVLGNGEQFRITNVTNARDDETGLRYTELSLTRLDENYEITGE